MGSQRATALFLLLLGLADGRLKVDLNGSWLEGVGWQMTCRWSLNNELQSVRLYRDEAQFLIFRPERQGPNITFSIDPSPHDTRMTVNCFEDSMMAGTCNITLTLLRAPKFGGKYKCEVSEEAPRFDMGQSEYIQEVFVPPSPPQLQIRNPMLEASVVNCTSSGIPAPKLMWRAGDQQIPETFSNRVWSSDTKLWQSWSAVSVTQAEDGFFSCTASVVRPNGAVVEEIVYYSSGNQLIGGNILIVAFTLLVLLR